MAPVPRNFVRENREWRCLADDRFRVAGVVDQPPPLFTHMVLSGQVLQETRQGSARESDRRHHGRARARSDARLDLGARMGPCRSGRMDLIEISGPSCPRKIKGRRHTEVEHVSKCNKVDRRRFR